MKITLFLIASTLASCAPQAFEPGTPNPLNEPGSDGNPSAAELHAGNIASITGNPTRARKY